MKTTVAILNPLTKTVSVITLTEKQLKETDGDIEEYLVNHNLIDSSCNWLSDIENVVINRVTL